VKALIAAALLLALGVAARADPAPVEHQTFALSHSNINVGSLRAMREDISQAGAMRERNYFEAPPLGAGVFRCRFAPVLFSMTHRTPSCR
jgi:hypothetical protein